MRADRLVAILLMLQTRGQVTAAEVATELEISERTARRDLESLSIAGIPVYSKQGRNGGWQLLGGGRTDLSGLSAPEARALFLVAGPASAATPEVKAALRKLVRALPETFRAEAEAASSAIVVDRAGWGQTARTAPPPPHLDTLQRAVVQGVQVELAYVSRTRESTTRTIHPLGLAAKGPQWYLVANTDAGMRTFRVDRVVSAEVLAAPVVRPEGFDLAAAWELISGEVDELRVGVWAEGWADPGVISLLRHLFDRRVKIGPARPDDGWVAVEIGSAHVDALAGEVAGLGDRLDLAGPPEVIERLRLIGAQLVGRYGAVVTSS